MHTTLRPSIATYKSAGILTCCPSGAAFAIPLGPTNPWLIDIAKETLVFRRAQFSCALWLLVPTFLLRNAPVWVTPLPSQRMRILSYRLQASSRRDFQKIPQKLNKRTKWRGRAVALQSRTTGVIGFISSL